MLLSDQQKYIISVLQQVKYIRLRQLYALTVQHYRKERFVISQHRMDVMLRQLRTGTNFVYFQEDVVCYGKRTVDERYLEAVDVMLKLTYCEPEFFSCERLEPPASLHRADREAALSPHGHVDGYPVSHYGDTAHEGGEDYLALGLVERLRHRASPSPYSRRPSGGRHPSLFWLAGAGKNIMPGGYEHGKKKDHPGRGDA